MAAIILVGVIVGVSSIDNSIKIGSSNEAFYDLSEEVGFETKKVLDYGVFSFGDPLQEVEGFFEKYIDYIGKEQVVLVVGDSTNMRVYYFTETSGNIGINTGGTDIGTGIQILDLEGNEASVSKTGEMVSVLISEINYEFNLRDGENFFFVIIKHEEGEKFVATG
jgi:hypothetical protein